MHISLLTCRSVCLLLMSIKIFALQQSPQWLGYLCHKNKTSKHFYFQLELRSMERGICPIAGLAVRLTHLGQLLVFILKDILLFNNKTNLTDLLTCLILAWNMQCVISARQMQRLPQEYCNTSNGVCYTDSLSFIAHLQLSDRIAG